jgi:imidazole glycerol-phosphate synthase subunit HisH
MNLVIIKYNAGNIQSVLYALNRVGIYAVVTDNKEIIATADKVIFPGVGEASTAMNYLKERQLDTFIKELKQPVLGICLGMQLMCTYSEENNTDCLGIFDEKVKKFTNDISALGTPLKEVESGRRLKVPQMGWNNIYNLKSPLFKGIKEDSYSYFVHSYYASLGEDTIATTNYILPYSSALHKDNFYGVQFHPEKSAATGEALLKNFIEL